MTLAFKWNKFRLSAEPAEKGLSAMTLAFKWNKFRLSQNRLKRDK